MTQHDIMYSAHRSLANANEAALHILPTLTRGELATLIVKNPATWARYSAWLNVLPEVLP